MSSYNDIPFPFLVEDRENRMSALRLLQESGQMSLLSRTSHKSRVRSHRPFNTLRSGVRSSVCSSAKPALIQPLLSPFRPLSRPLSVLSTFHSQNMDECQKENPVSPFRIRVCLHSSQVVGENGIERHKWCSFSWICKSRATHLRVCFHAKSK